MANNHKQLKKEYQGLVAVVAKVIKEWDPYALLEGGAPDDEFDSEVSLVVAQVSRITSPSDAAQAISRVFSAQFEPNLFTPELCAQVGEQLFTELKSHGYV